MIRPSDCPICRRPLPTASTGNPADSQFLPFCSERCRLVDLHRWSVGQYAIVEPLDPELFDLTLRDEDLTRFQERNSDE